MMLRIGAGHSNNCQVILKLFRYDIFLQKLAAQKMSSKFEDIGGINHLRDK